MKLAYAQSHAMQGGPVGMDDEGHLHGLGDLLSSAARSVTHDVLNLARAAGANSQPAPGGVAVTMTSAGSPDKTKIMTYGAIGIGFLALLMVLKKRA